MALVFATETFNLLVSESLMEPIPRPRSKMYLFSISRRRSSYQFSSFLCRDKIEPRFWNSSVRKRSDRDELQGVHLPALCRRIE